MNNSAWVYEDLARYANARLPPIHPSTAICQSNLAGHYRATARTQEAESLDETAAPVIHKFVAGKPPGTVLHIGGMTLRVAA